MRHDPIKSTDPDAIDQLRAKLADLITLQERMVKANKIVKKFASPVLIEFRPAALTALTALGVPDPSRLFEPDFCGRLGFPSYALTNNNATIRRIKQRIEEVTRLQARPEAEPEQHAG